MEKGTVWLDAGTFNSLIQSSMYVQTIQNRQNILIGSPEETSYINGWISKKQFKKKKIYISLMMQLKLTVQKII